MFDSDDGRHEDVYFMAMNFESVIAEELGDTVVGFHDLGLRFFIAWYHHYGCVFSEHQLKIIDMFIKWTRSAHLVGLGNEIFTLGVVVFDLVEVVAVDLQGFGVVGVDSC